MDPQCGNRTLRPVLRVFFVCGREPTLQKNEKSGSDFLKHKMTLLREKNKGSASGK